jgi:hypothetical protein
LYQTQESNFEDERVVKEWYKNALTAGEPAYNRLLLTTHRVIIEKKRIVGRIHSELTSRHAGTSSFWSGLVQLVSFFQWLLTMGADTDNLLLDDNILLRGMCIFAKEAAGMTSSFASDD